MGDPSRSSPLLLSETRDHQVNTKQQGARRRRILSSGSVSILVRVHLETVGQELRRDGEEPATEFQPFWQVGFMSSVSWNRRSGERRCPVLLVLHYPPSTSRVASAVAEPSMEW